MMHPLWKTVKPFLKKLKHRITLSYNDSTLVIYTKELKAGT